MFNQNPPFGTQGMGPNVGQQPFQTPTQQFPYPMPQQQQQVPMPGISQPYPQQQPQQPQQYNPYGYPSQPQGFPATPQFEESYIENILRLNKGKLCTIYCTFSDSQEWRDRAFKGIIEAAGRDHTILSDPNTGYRYVILNVYIDWIEFFEEINYEYPFR